MLRQPGCRRCGTIISALWHVDEHTVEHVLFLWHMLGVELDTTFGRMSSHVLGLHALHITACLAAAI